MRIKLESGGNVFDISERIISVSKIHEVLDDNGKFVIPTFDFSIDNSDNWLDTYNSQIKAITVNVDVHDYDSDKTIYHGSLINPTPANDFGKKLLQFESQHDIAGMKEIGRQFSAGQDDAAATLGSFLGIGDPTYKFKFTWNADVWWAANLVPSKVWVRLYYFYNYQTNLSFLGDILRSFGCVLIIEDGKLTITDRDQIRHGVDYDDSDLLSTNFNESWHGTRDGIKITTQNRLSGAQRTILSNNVDENISNLYEINTDLLTNIVQRVSGGFSGIYTILRSYILNRYENYFMRNAEQMNITLNGLDKWLGKVIRINNKNYLIEETTKDLENETTEATIVSV